MRSLGCVLFTAIVLSRLWPSALSLGVANERTLTEPAAAAVGPVAVRSLGDRLAAGLYVELTSHTEGHRVEIVTKSDYEESVALRKEVGQLSRLAESLAKKLKTERGADERAKLSYEHNVAIRKLARASSKKLPYRVVTGGHDYLEIVSDVDSMRLLIPINSIDEVKLPFPAEAEEPDPM
jgi:hypothetical protein